MKKIEKQTSKSRHRSGGGIQQGIIHSLTLTLTITKNQKPKTKNQKPKTKNQNLNSAKTSSQSRQPQGHAQIDDESQTMANITMQQLKQQQQSKKYAPQRLSYRNHFQ